MMKKIGILPKLIVLMVSVVAVSLFMTSLFMREYIYTRENDVIAEEIKSTAKLVSKNDKIKNIIKSRKQDIFVQEYALDVMKLTQVDFIVVMDIDFIRYSHPTSDLVGGVFSNVEDASATLTLGDHYSEQKGTLGEGIRFFTSIYDDDGTIIGVVCVGYTKKTVSAQIWKAQLQLLTALCIGLFVAVILAVLFAKWLKKVLLNLEPEEIAQSVIEKELISEHVTEGIIGIGLDKRIIFANSSANALLKKANIKVSLEVGKTLPEDLYDLFFKNALEKELVKHDMQMIVNDTEFLMNSNPIYLHRKLYGAVVTLRDQSDMQQLITELSGTEKYNDSLRAQNHHFMNQMHVLQGLIDLGLFDEVESYISYLKQDYHAQIGHISDTIKVPAITGLLLGKSREASQQHITFTIDSDSAIEQKAGRDTLYHDLTIILGVLIDNAMEAVQSTPTKTIEVYLMANDDERVVLCTVTDTGVGIPETLKQIIFERGYSTKGANRGYGLEAVATIVQKYGGTIDVISQVDKGTRINIELPITEE
ncbi:GHKL domain-containing protein [Granulicatella sp. zg-ZJ]|uniref:ATP-binding protein n=1 Tax=Granulicatella sp. zg-ZJ TaxID=2678504 RepID=UPI0013D51410|nr:ATP-binding protein [Granulicatella sp. zg-ZJ]NEW62733.1 GHKL domain-containing protein [Granulicatella sp. zg-ZJ]